MGWRCTSNQADTTITGLASGSGPAGTTPAVLPHAGFTDRPLSHSYRECRHSATDRPRNAHALLQGRSLLADGHLLFFALPSRNLSAAYLPVGVIISKE
jgi:hypothetical protein